MVGLTNTAGHRKRSQSRGKVCASLKQVHWKTALGTLGYVRRTSWVGVTFQRDVVSGLSMQVFVDADYASKATDRRSVSGDLEICGGGCVSWFLRTQEYVKILTTEAEYVAMADVPEEILFLREVWRFIFTGSRCMWWERRQREGKVRKATAVR